MKKMIITIIVCYAFMPANAQLFKKLKAEAEQRFKEKIEQKKTARIDEVTEKSATKVASVPDSAAQKTIRKIKEMRKNGREKKDSTSQGPSPAVLPDSSSMILPDSSSSPSAAKN